MQITLLADSDETFWVDVLNALARHNERQYRADSSLPPLYRSGVRYLRNEQDLWCMARPDACSERVGELWCDIVKIYELGFEDCDGLAAARAGELLARGASALTQRDGPAFYVARARRAREIQAQVFLRTRQPEGERGGLYHCLVRYRLRLGRNWSRWFTDDPSARLGMGSDAPDALLST